MFSAKCQASNDKCLLVMHGVQKKPDCAKMIPSYTFGFENTLKTLPSGSSNKILQLDLKGSDVIQCIL